MGLLHVRRIRLRHSRKFLSKFLSCPRKPYLARWSWGPLELKGLIWYLHFRTGKPCKMASLRKDVRPASYLISQSEPSKYLSTEQFSQYLSTEKSGTFKTNTEWTVNQDGRYETQERLTQSSGLTEEADGHKGPLLVPRLQILGEFRRGGKLLWVPLWSPKLSTERKTRRKSYWFQFYSGTLL